MGHKIFVSYKYADSNVKQINTFSREHDTVRTYVNQLEKYISETSEHIYKGEGDNEDLSDLTEDTIWEKLKERIYDSSLTIIMISPGMRDPYLSDKEQWIPWEISYSLKEVSRKTKSGEYKSSFSNAMLAIVLPDRFGSYSYYTYTNTCCSTKCRHLNTNFLFDIMRLNMFNINNPNAEICNNNSKVYHGDSSYISSVKWDDFIADPEKYIKNAYDIQSKIVHYKIVKDL